MREILFRGKRLDNGDWVEGYLVKQPSAVHIGDYSPWYIHVPPVDPDDTGGVYNVFTESIGQYTGLTDKNGRKIFEGDMIVAFDIWGHKVDCGIVNWSDLFLAWHAGKTSMYGGSIATYEIFGNIYDGEGCTGSE